MGTLKTMEDRRLGNPFAIYTSGRQLIFRKQKELKQKPIIFMAQFKIGCRSEQRSFHRSKKGIWNTLKVVLKKTLAPRKIQIKSALRSLHQLLWLTSLKQLIINASVYVGEKNPQPVLLGMIATWYYHCEIPCG